MISASIVSPVYMRIISPMGRYRILPAMKYAVKVDGGCVVDWRSTSSSLLSLLLSTLNPAHGLLRIHFPFFVWTYSNATLYAYAQI